MNEKTEDQAEGWKDNDDWGSLEDNKSSTYPEHGSVLK